MKSVTIVDYGMGNIKSLYNCLKFLGYNPIFYSESKSIKSNICILPGVGAYNHAMKLLKEKNILNDLVSYVGDNKNILIGICLGMQLFFEESTENSNTIGLGLINGKVKKLSTNKNDILPNVGWLETNITPNNRFDYLKKFNNKKFYYVHSYFAEPMEKKNQIATSKYNGENFCAITVKNSNIIGTQFHPEKSSEVGLEFLKVLIDNSIN